MSNLDHEAKKAAMAELQRMSKAAGGKITPEQLVEAARSEGSPLHRYFEWDDKEAADKYRLMQARTLIRSCKFNVTVNNRKVELPLYSRDPEADTGDQGYVETARIRGQEDLAREIIVTEFKRAATQLRKARHLAMYFQMTEEVDDLIEGIVGLQTRIEASAQENLNA